MVLDGLWPGLELFFFCWPAGPRGPDGLWPGLEVFFFFAGRPPQAPGLLVSRPMAQIGGIIFFLFWPGQRSGLELFFYFLGRKQPSGLLVSRRNGGTIKGRGRAQQHAPLAQCKKACHLVVLAYQDGV